MAEQQKQQKFQHQTKQQQQQSPPKEKEEQQQEKHQKKVEKLLGQVVTANKSSEFRLMEIKTSPEEAKRRKAAQELDQKCLEKKNKYDQFMRDQSAFIS